ncbi:MAG: hypothetical protein L0Y39_03945 [Methylococcaceae bacterium]|nr:hypothetical protein [Methylococcaceae bacterium]
MLNLKSCITRTGLMVGLLGVISPTFAQDYGGYIYVPQPYANPYYPGGQSGYDNGSYYEYYGNGVNGGYGYRNNDGSWYHQNGDYSGGYSVGGDGSGCIYTPDWSNC